MKLTILEIVQILARIDSKKPHKWKLLTMTVKINIMSREYPFIFNAIALWWTPKMSVFITYARENETIFIERIDSVCCSRFQMKQMNLFKRRKKNQSKIGSVGI